VVGVQRRFDASDVISIADAEGNEFARGMANHGSEEAAVLASGAARTRHGKAAAAKPVVLVSRDNIVVHET
jgi:glutamate 5-kinase